MSNDPLRAVNPRFDVAVTLSLRRRMSAHAGASFCFETVMKLHLIIDSNTLDIDIDDIVAGLLAARLELPVGADNQDVLARYLSDKGAPWTLDEEHMRRRIFRRLILDIADPALIIRHLMAEQ